MEEVKLPTGIQAKSTEDLRNRREELFRLTGIDQFHKEFLIGKLLNDNREILDINNELRAREEALAKEKAKEAAIVPEVVTSEATASV